jgi:hypothetical protein
MRLLNKMDRQKWKQCLGKYVILLAVIFCLVILLAVVSAIISAAVIVFN